MAAPSGSQLLDFDGESDYYDQTFARPSNAEAVAEDDDELLWAAIEKLPDSKKVNTALLRRSMSEIARSGGDEGSESAVTIDVRKLDRNQRELVVKKALATSEQDNIKLLSGIKDRLNRVNLELPKVEVRFQKLNVEAKVQIGKRALPTLLNSTRDALERIGRGFKIFRPDRHKLTILNNISGCLKPGRMTLLLGPPGAGKSTLLLALAGKLDPSLEKVGKITYNGYGLDEFCVQRTSAYISQTDSHIAELTVRETLDFAARCQGASEAYAGLSKNVQKLEEEKRIHPVPEIDAFMKASAVKGRRTHISTDYVLKVLGLDVCAETVVGNEMRRGVSGGQRKRVTTGEMVVGPRKTLFMDEISTGLDSSTTFQIVKCIGNYVHLMEGTVLMALLQPAPETFELFDDLILLSEGYMVYHGPRSEVLELFESLGFKLPARKGVADFLQEVTSRKDQEQYWADPSKPYRFIPVAEIAEAFKKSRFGKYLEQELGGQMDKSSGHPRALEKTKYAVPKMELLKACLARESLLIRRQSFLYIFRTCQVAFVGFVACTTFTRATLHPTNEIYGQLYLSCLFYGLVHMLFNGFSELSLTIFRLPVFYKQRDNCFYPAWAWSFASWLLRIPYSVLEAVVWSIVVYYPVGFAPAPGRFFRFMFLLFLIHQMAMGLFRLLASLARDMTIANTVSSAMMLAIFCMGGFIIPKDMIKPWWSWAYWVSPLSYGQNAISVNEFTATRWMVGSSLGNTTIGENILRQHSIPVDANWYWIGAGVLGAYAIFFNSMVTVALAFLNPPKKSKAIVPLDTSEDKASEKNAVHDEESEHEISSGSGGKTGGMILPFQPLTMTFHNVNYYVDMPKAMKAKGLPETKLQLLSNVSGVFSPGVLTALVGSSGAGKTTLMDVLAGRKTGGVIKGDIRISGHPKEQRTFARISGYVEQNDIHSPQVTVKESLWFSSALRLPKDLSREKRDEFVEEVMRLVELDNLRHALVGMPGTSGLSTEQRKRLTIGVELVANPSIIFMDEPTSGLDARAAAIVMRTVRNTVDTGRTVVCTIHQPSIDIFEAFDELLLMKRGGRVIYGGKLGIHSQTLIDYFQGISEIPKIPEGYNPATWMLEVTTPAVEERIGEDFANIYEKSNQFREVEASIKDMSVPQPGSSPLKFDTEFSQNLASQFLTCLRKQNIIYWRSPQYNAVRIFLTTLIALLLGSVFWDAGSKRDTVINVFALMGALYAACLFLGVSNSSSVQPIVAIERAVFYREKAAGMYSPLPYAAAQGLIEIPYIAAQTIIYSVITYLMINFERTLRFLAIFGLRLNESFPNNSVLAGKFVLYTLFMFLTFTYFTFYGMMAVGLTPNQHMAAVTSSAFYSLWNLFSGFLVPKQFIPGWWMWFYYICPVAWSLRGLITSQLGDVETILTGSGFEVPVKEYLKQQFGYTQEMLGFTVLVLTGFCVLFFGSFMASARYLNFQRR